MEIGANSTLLVAKVNKTDSGNYTCSIGESQPYTVLVHVLNGKTNRPSSLESFSLLKFTFHVSHLTTWFTFGLTRTFHSADFDLVSNFPPLQARCSLFLNLFVPSPRRDLLWKMIFLFSEVDEKNETSQFFIAIRFHRNKESKLVWFRRAAAVRRKIEGKLSHSSSPRACSLVHSTTNSILYKEVSSCREVFLSISCDWAKKSV